MKILKKLLLVLAVFASFFPAFALAAVTVSGSPDDLTAPTGGGYLVSFGGSPSSYYMAVTDPCGVTQQRNDGGWRTVDLLQAGVQSYSPWGAGQTVSGIAVDWTVTGSYVFSAYNDSGFTSLDSQYTFTNTHSGSCPMPPPPPPAPEIIPDWVPTATVWALSALLLMCVIIFVYFLIFFMIFAVAGWGASEFLKPILKLFNHDSH